MFPDFVKQYIPYSAPLRRGIDHQVIDIQTINFRHYTHDKHQKVDDILYGGGPGLLLKPDVIVEAVESNISSQTKLIMIDPKGEIWNQSLAKEFSQYQEVAFLCGRYEGFDARIETILKPRMISLGDFIITNGDIALLVILDSIIRLIEGTCDNIQSTIDESFSEGLLESDQYTRPAIFRNLKVPSVLQNGNHQAIAKFKEKSSLKNSFQKRPDLFTKLDLNKLNLEDMIQILKEIYYVDEYRRDS